MTAISQPWPANAGYAPALAVSHPVPVWRPRGRWVSSPLGAVLTIWSVVGLLFYLGLVQFPALSVNFWFAVGLGAAGAVLGDLLARIRTHPRNERIPRRVFFSVNRARVLNVFHYSMSAGAAGVALMYVTVFLQVSPAAFLTQQSSVKGLLERNHAGEYLSMFAYVALVLGAVLVYSCRMSWTLLAAPSVLVALYSASFWGKMPLLLGIYLVLTVRMCLAAAGGRRQSASGGRGRSWWKRLPLVVLGPVLLLCLLSWSVEFRLVEYEYYDPTAGRTSGDVRAWLDEHRLWFGSARSAFVLYSYATESLCALDYWVSRPSEMFMGQVSAEYVGRLLRTTGLLDGELPHAGRIVYHEGVRLQLPSALAVAYMDFGWAGLFVGPFLLINFASASYYRWRLRPSIRGILELPMYYAVLLLSPWAFLLAHTSAAFLLLALLLIGRSLHV